MGIGNTAYPFFKIIEEINIMAITKQSMTKRINIITFILIAVLFTTLFLIPVAKASDDTVVRMATMILSGATDQCQTIISDSDPLYGKLVTSDDLGYDTLNNIYKAVKIIGAMWVIIIAMGHLITNIEKGQDPVESTFKVLIEIGITLIFLMNLDEVIKVIGQLGTIIVQMTTPPTPLTIEGVDEFVKDMVGEESGFAWNLKAMAVLAVPFFLSFLAIIACKFAMYQIILEIGIRKAFAPMAVADVYQEGLRSPGVRYLKKFLALFVRLACAVAVCAIMAPLALNAAQEGEGFMKCANLLIMNFTAIGFIFKSGEVENDIVGV